MLEILPAVSTEQLRYALDQRGLRLDGGQLRRRREGEAALPPPVATGGEDQIQESTVPAGGTPRGGAGGNDE